MPVEKQKNVLTRDKQEFAGVFFVLSSVLSFVLSLQVKYFPFNNVL